MKLNGDSLRMLARYINFVNTHSSWLGWGLWGQKAIHLDNVNDKLY